MRYHLSLFVKPKLIKIVLHINNLNQIFPFNSIFSLSEKMSIVWRERWRKVCIKYSCCCFIIEYRNKKLFKRLMSWQQPQISFHDMISLTSAFIFIEPSSVMDMKRSDALALTVRKAGKRNNIWKTKEMMYKSVVRFEPR